MLDEGGTLSRIACIEELLELSTETLERRSTLTSVATQLPEETFPKSARESEAPGSRDRLQLAPTHQLSKQINKPTRERNEASNGAVPTKGGPINRAASRCSAVNRSPGPMKLMNREGPAPAAIAVAPGARM